jgi:hypothetical protein
MVDLFPIDFQAAKLSHTRKNFHFRFIAVSRDNLVENAKVRRVSQGCLDFAGR